MKGDYVRMLVGWGYVVSKLNKFKRLKIKEVVSYWIWEMNDEVEVIELILYF